MTTSATKTSVSQGLAEKRALVAARLRQAASQPRQSPLSFAQQRLWFLDQLEPNSPLYNIGAVTRIEGSLDRRKLQQAIEAIVARHETLRTRFTCPDEAPVQIVDPNSQFDLRFVDLSSLDRAEAELEAGRRIQAELNQPFDLSSEHPLRGTLIRLWPDEHRLVLILHHIVADEWSLKILFRELSALYEANLTERPAVLPKLAIQYSDFARWQRQSLQGDLLEEQLRYWREKLSGAPAVTELPTDRPRGVVPTFNGKTAIRGLSAALTESLKALGKKHEATLFMVLLAAFKAVIHRYTQQEDLVVCAPIAGRNRVETEGIIGFFVNTLALRTSVTADPSFTELLARVRESTLGAMAHQELPFERLVEELQPERSLTHLPFTKLMFSFQTGFPEQIELGSARLHFLEVEPELAKFELTLSLRETDQGLRAAIEYNSDLFEADSISRLLGHFEVMLEGIVAGPQRRLSQLPLLTGAERDQMLRQWNDTTRAYPRDRCIHEVFEAQVARDPEATALVWGRQKMSYGELNTRANQLARFLKRFDIRPDVPVGLCTTRSLEMIVGMLGILKAGGAYVPLDANYPKERLAFMLEDIGAAVILTQQRLLERLPRAEAKLVCLDADWELIAREPRENTAGLANARNLAYVMYTSGSTGRPKGVAVPHRAVNRLVIYNDYVQFNSTDRIAQVSNISFDAATFEIWGALLNGAQLVGITRDVALSPREFASELRAQGITAMFLTAALFNQLASEVPGAFETVRTLIAGGEALDPKWVRAVLRDRPPQRLVNGYGPTENTTFSCCHTITGLSDQAWQVPIGKPISNSTAYILDPHLNPVPIGVAGELYTGGDGVARGYWRRPELTAEKFVLDPFDPQGGGRLYKTGDLARFLSDGTIEFLGRMDQQVKIRGFRIELGEIETQLGEHPGVRECVVTVCGESSAEKRLVAYVASASESAPNASELRSFLTAKLPEYMVPSAFVHVASMPLTPNGKIDRKALPAPDQTRPKLDKQYVAPRDETERRLASIWETVLGVRPVGVQDRFFDLGGHSMLAVRVISQIEKAFGKKLRLATLFQAPTVERLAAVVREEIKETAIAAGSSLVEIQAAGFRPPLFLVHGAGGGMFWGYVNLARHLGPDQPVYGFKSRGLDGQAEFATIEEIAAHYVADLRKLQRHGPYYLGGYCFGGNVAYEMACQLRAQGEEVALLAVLNCAPPNSSYSRIPWTPGWGLKFARNLLYWANYFSHWSATQRREFFRWKWKLIRKRLAGRRSAGGDNLTKIEPGDLVDLSSYTEDQKKIWESHIRGLMSFRPRAYAGKVHLFRSPGHPLWCSFEEHYGWGDLARSVEVVSVSGAHEKILEEPWVKALAEQLSDALRVAQQRHDLGGADHNQQPATAVSAGDAANCEPGQEGAKPAFETVYPELFARRIRSQRDQVAVRFQDHELSYAELDRRSNQLAHYLQQQGVGPESLVAVALERSLDLGVGLLAVLKAGGAYLPLDPDHPQERLALMVNDARPRLLLAHSLRVRNLPSTELGTICLDDPAQQSAISQCSDALPTVVLTPENLAYVIYTSGSTGTPKGVEIPHRALCNHNLGIVAAYELQAADRVLQFTPLSFDISVEEIFPTWLSGATLVLRTEDSISSVDHFLRLLRTERITVLNLPTAYWHELVEHLHVSGAHLPESVRLVVIGGEKPAEQAFQRWSQCVRHSVKLINGYGATEATITTTLYEAQSGDQSLPIGRPIPNTQAVILDEQLQPVARGTAGQLFLGGAGLARGYLRRPELTNEAFIANPVPSLVDGSRLYRTGDLALERMDGNLEFIGRLDDQVKVRGYRIELGEVEWALRSHPGVKDAAAVVSGKGQGGGRLVAYFVPRSSGGVTVAGLLPWLQGKLPRYMVPSVLVPLPALPLTPAGKIDRHALPAPTNVRPDLGRPFVPPGSPLEEQLANIWTEVLELSAVGVNDDFIELGGHSLLALKVLSRIRESLQVDLSLAEFFHHPTISCLARHLAALTPSTTRANPVEGVRLPLSPAQERIWFLDQLDPRRTAYNRAVGIQLTGELKIEALQQALSSLAGRHEALRAVFPAENGTPNQVLTEASEIPLPISDLSSMPDSQKQQQALEIAAQAAYQPHSLSQPIFKTLLLRFNQAEHLLVLILNDIVADESSARLILRELPKLYDAACHQHDPDLPGLPAPYADLVSSIPDVSSHEEARQLDYWKDQLRTAPELLELPGDRPRPAQADYAGARCPLAVDSALAKAVASLAAQAACEPFVVFLAAFATVLQRYTNSDDIVIGSVTSLRSSATRNVVGPFENRVALRCDLSGDPSFRELIHRLAKTREKALENAAVPFGNVVAAVRPQASASFTPIFQVFLTLDEKPLPETSVAGLRFSPFEIDTQTSRFDLSLRLIANQEALSGWVRYSTALFDDARVQRLTEHFLTLLRRAMAQPDLALSRLDILPGHEARTLLTEWTATAGDFPREKTLADLFHEQAERTPDAEALVCGSTRLTYAQLHAYASRVAARLRSSGVEREALVGICFERSVEMVTSILGTLLAGGAYVPLDPKYPKDRLAYTLQDAKVRVLLTQQSLLGLFQNIDAPIICLDGSPEPDDKATAATPVAASGPSDLAYVIYTSGSTGQPKGVALEHRNAVAFVSWAQEVFTAEELSGVLASTSICFDLSVFELFVPLCSGGKVILVDNALSLAGLPNAREVRLINTVPSAIRELLRLRAVPATVRVINLAGEPLSAELVDQIYAETSVARVFDLYGPTETTTYSTGGIRKPGQPATIGRPLTNEQVYLLDSKLRPVPIGVAGELLIGGAGVARGYLNRPDLTAERFIPHPLQAGARLYRTGDLARWRPDGNLEYLGRMDHQVKIRGFRIELGEIETVLKAQPAISSTVVVAREDRPGDKRLVAYLVLQPGSSVTPDKLKEKLRTHLPDFMVPSEFVVLKEMPLTPNGKIDRKALPAPVPCANNSRDDLVAPRTPIEEQLAGIWREVLGVEQISVQDNFFDLGGHSLLAVRVISAVRDKFKVELPLSALFATPKIGALAEVLSGLLTKGGQVVSRAITPVQRTGGLPVSYVQERLWFLDQLEPGSAAYNVPVALRVQGELDLPALRKALNQVVSRHEILRTRFQYQAGELMQVVAEHVKLELPCIEIHAASKQEQEKQMRDVVNQHARRPFDLAAVPLIRASVFRLAETDHVLLVVMHHTVSDGWSLALLFQELGAIYDSILARAAEPQLPPLTIQYADFASWQRQFMAGPVLDRELAHWKNLLEGAPSEIALPLDHPRPSSPSGRANFQASRISAATLRALNEFTRRESCTPFAFFLTALMITLRRWTNQPDLVVGTVVAGRTRRELENLVGCFMNFLPLRAQIGDGETGRGLLGRIRETVLSAQTHQDCPFEKIVGAVNPHRQRDRNPLYNVALLLQNFPLNLFETANLRSSAVPVSLEAALLDLRFEIEQIPEGLSLSCEYKTDLFEPETIQGFLSSWLRVIDRLVTAPETKLPEFELTEGLARSSNPTPSPADLATFAVAATFTAEPIAESLQFWFRRLELAGKIEFAPYNQVFQQLLDPSSLLGANRRGLNVLLVRLEDWQATGAPGQSSTDSALANIERSAEEFLEAVKAAAGRGAVSFLICICPPSVSFAASADRAERIARIESRLTAGLSELTGVCLLTQAELTRWYPIADYDDPAGEQLGKVPYTPQFFTALGTAVARKSHALTRAPYKVIALDCDNTLWTGVCGEEGPTGVLLDDARRALQEFMRGQRDSGMLLCLCSKNNEEDVQAVFSQRGEFPLQMQHFAACRLNWQPKSANLKSLAKELGLGLDSFVFVDDNPVECAEVQANCSEVLTLQLPEDPGLIPQFLNHCWVFDHVRVTAEDRQRAEQYAQKRQREQLQAEAPTLEAFISGLQLQVAIDPVTADHYPRVAQLTQRTNQFNVTTRRRSEQDLSQWLNSGHGLVVKVSDRFGDHGLVGVILYQLNDEAVVVDTFLLSCRVLGRGVEHRILARLGEIAQETGLPWVDVHFVPSAKNKPALDFLEKVGARFKQPLNGGSVFRLPAAFAAKVAFCPAEQVEPRSKERVETGPSESSGLSGSNSRFALCQSLALEANDPARIHQQIRDAAAIRHRAVSAHTPPTTELQRKLCQLWEDLLHVKPVGITDDFFDLGGHSLLAVRLFAEIEKIVGRKFPLVTLFQAPTVEQLARVLSEGDGEASLLVPIQPRGDKPPLFLVHGAGGDVLWGYANLAAHLPADQPIYGIRSHGQQGLPEKLHLEEMARSYLEVVQARQPQGPYYLGGYCFGGNVAYEMARQLRMQGQQVALVVLIDTAPANAGYETLTWWRPNFPWRFACNLRYWFSDFMALEASDRRRFVGRKFRALGRKLGRRLGLRAGNSHFDLEEVIDPRHFPENELKLWQIHLEALIAHIERPYSGSVALLRTHGQPLFCSLEDDFCWGKLVSAQVKVRHIPGSHENIFMEPNVRVLAAELEGLLQTTQPPAPHPGTVLAAARSTQSAHTL